LLIRFGGIRELAKAPVDEIAKVHGISEELAIRIYQYFHVEDR
jgi:excinuclease ABC subunit C